MKNRHSIALASCLMIALIMTLTVAVKVDRDRPSNPASSTGRNRVSDEISQDVNASVPQFNVESSPILSAAEIAPTATGKPLPTYIIRSRPAQLNLLALPTRTSAPGREDRLEIFPDVTPTVKWEQISDNGSGNWAWFGSLLEDRLSMVTLTRVADYTILDVQSPKFGHYEVHGQDGKPAEVRQFDADQVNSGCKTSVMTAEFGAAAALEFIEETPVREASSTTAAFTVKTVDVLMVYTIRARDLVGGRSAIAARAQSAVNGLNNNFTRPSGTENDIVHIMRLMGARETGHTASNSLPTELGWVAGNSGVETMRNETGADFVAFISDKDDAGIRGIAQLPGAFSANYYDTLGGVWPHEAGHNFGCQHNSPGVYSYASGHYWNDSSNGVQYGSVMSYIGSRIPYFSNPDVTYSGHATGTSSRNNALCVNNRGDDAAAYKSSKTLIEPSCVVTSSTNKPNVGVDFTVTIKTTNGGPSTATSAKMNVALPSLLTLISHNGGAAFDTNTKVWSIPSLADNASASLVLTLRPTASASGVSQTVSASVGSLGTNVVDYDIYNNSGSVSMVSVPLATSSLVLHYPLDETTGKTAKDSCPNEATQNATTTYASPQWQPSGGMIGGSLLFTPSAQVDVAQAFSYNSSLPIINNYPFTMALWLKTGTSAWYEVCAMLGDQTTGGSYFELSVNNSKANAMARNTTNVGVSATSPTTISDNQWHHVAGVFTSATSRTLYLNGVAVATNTTSVPFVPNNKRFSIGALMRDAPNQSYPGQLDDIGLWNTALPKEHIALIHALGRFSEVDLDDPAIATLLAGGTPAQAGELLWTPTTGLTGAVGSTGMLNGEPYLVLTASGGGVIGSSAHDAVGLWFDPNGSATGFGLEDSGNYDWLGTNFWNSNNAAEGDSTTWSNLGDDAFLVGAGDETQYTVRLGAGGTSNVTLRNMLLNSDGADPSGPIGAGNVVIGSSGDAGVLQLSGSNTIGSAGGILTIHNPVSLGSNRTMNFCGGSVNISGLVSGTGTSGLSLAPGGSFTGELATGLLTLTNSANNYTGPTTIATDFSLEIGHLANGGIASGIGASPSVATNLVLGGGTLRYTGASTSTDRNFVLSPESTSIIDVIAPGTVLTISGASTATNGGFAKVGEGTLQLSGTNLHTGTVALREGTVSVGTTANLGNGNGLVFEGGTLQVTGTALTSFSTHTATFIIDSNVGIDIAAAANTFTISQPVDLGSGGLIKSGAGTLALTNANVLSGPALVNAGALTISNAEALGSTAGVIVAENARLNINQASVQGPANPTAFDMPIRLGIAGGAAGGTIRFNAPSNRSNYSINGPVTLEGSGISSIVSYNAGLNFINLLGGITGSGGLEIQAGGANSGHSHVFNLGGTLDYGGETRLVTSAASGRVCLNAGTLPPETVLSMGAQVNQGTNMMAFDLNGNNQVLAGLQTIVFNGGGTGRNQVINTSATAAILTVDNSTDYTFTGNLGANGQPPVGGTAGTGDNFSLIKNGEGVLAITGTNTYTGTTVVNAGILAVNASSIADTGKLVIDGGKVEPTGTEIVNSLFFGGVQQASGTWGAPGSDADHIDDTHFSGSGLISVITGPPTDFGSWVLGFGIAAANQDPTDDPDGDGLNNLLEYVVGGNPGANDAPTISPVGTHSGSNYVFTFRRSDISEADTILTVEFGDDLDVLGSILIGASPGVAPVLIEEDIPNANFDTITVTLPTGGSPSFFARLKVVR